MKCTTCGWPLSPTRNDTNCPRCGAPILAGSKSSDSPVGNESAFWDDNSVSPARAGSFQQNRESGWNQADPSAVFQAPMSQTMASQPPQPPYPPHRPPNSTRIGFIAAGLCVIAGGILLVIVYFLAAGQTGQNATGSTSTPLSTHTAVSPSPSSSPARTPSPTATTYPAQQFVNNAQMSSVPPSATQRVQPTTTFKVNQKLYVIFDISSGGKSGAVCLIWYLNGKAAFNYALPVSAHTTSSFAYATYGTPGPAYVELYWASSATCSDQMLAQHVGFTVTT